MPCRLMQYLKLVVGWTAILSPNLWESYRAYLILIPLVALKYLICLHDDEEEDNDEIFIWLNET